MTIAREAWPFALPFALPVVLALAMGRPGWALAALVAGGAVTLFFRIPARRPPADDDAVLAPANGRVIAVDLVADPEVGPGRFHRVVTFLSVFDVHVQRAPVTGEVVRAALRPGRGVAAFRPEAGEVNEQRLLVLRTASGRLVGVRQIVGLLARRTVAYVGEGQSLARGELLGLIKFGSRVDLLLPEDWVVEVQRGARLREGLSVVARSRP